MAVGADALDAAEAENDHLRQLLAHACKQLAAVDALHDRNDDGGQEHWCGNCFFEWPCDTHLILHSEDVS